MAETIHLNMSGGPHPGTLVTDVNITDWPPPGIMAEKYGVYIKISESNIPPQEAGSLMVRSANYKWVPDSEL